MTPRATKFLGILAPRLREALADTPAVLIHGPRQSGKTTSPRAVGEPRDYQYVSFDDDAVLKLAKSDPIGFREPPSAKDDPRRSATSPRDLRVAQGSHRRTSSAGADSSSPVRANVLLVPALSDSLAGRMEILRLHPLSQCEIERTQATFHRPALRRGLLNGDCGTPRLRPRGARRGRRLPAALTRRDASRRSAWYRDYVETQVQRGRSRPDAVRALDAPPKLLAVVAANTARLINVVDLAAPFELSRQTIHEYTTLLEHVFLLDRLPPWHTNRLSRMIKRPKLHHRRYGSGGAVCSESMRASSTRIGHCWVRCSRPSCSRSCGDRRVGAPTQSTSHFRDRDDAEVDIVLEQGYGAVAGVEVKAAASVGDADFRGLRKLRDAAGARFVAGVVLHDGTAGRTHRRSPVRNTVATDLDMKGTDIRGTLFWLFRLLSYLACHAKCRRHAQPRFEGEARCVRGDLHRARASGSPADPAHAELRGWLDHGRPDRRHVRARVADDDAAPQVLESAGLLHHERRGRERVYRLDRKRLELVRDWLAWFSKNPNG